MSPGVKIYTVEDQVYFAPKVEYVSEETINVLAQHRVLIQFVRFTPNNGTDRGKPHVLPLARVSRVVEVS